MARMIGHLAAPVGKYIKDGEEKTKWQRCGVVLETDKGMRIKLECLPLVQGDSGIWFSVFEPDEQQQAAPAPQQAPQQAPAGGATDPDIPF